MGSWTRRIWASSVAVGSWLYIDGGEILSNSSSSASYQLDLANDTYAIDLSKSWTTADVTLKSITKPAGCPSFNHQKLLYNSKSNEVYAFGGEVSSRAPSNFVADPVSVWAFKPNANEGGTWSTYFAASEQPFSQGVLRPMGASAASGDKEGLVLGGFSNAATSPQTASLKDNIPIPGMIKFDFTAKRASNISAAGYSEYATSAWGGMQYVPSLGPSGVYIMLGGDTPPLGPYQGGSTLRRMDNITIYDPASQRWFHQTATGDEIPSPRQYFCMVGAGQRDSGSYELFIYGGYDGTKRAQSIKYDELWILTLPAFRYRKANYTASHSRHGHTCSVIGNRHMITIGGGETLNGDFASEAKRADPVFDGGIGLFDMSDLAWTKKFDSTAQPYVRAGVINDLYTANGRFPKTWDQPEAKDLIQNNKSPSSTTSTTSDGNAASTSSSKGGLIGGVVGGVVGGILLILAGLFLFRRRKQSRQVSDPEASADTSMDKTIAPDEDSDPSGNAAELSTTANIAELPAPMSKGPETALYEKSGASVVVHEKSGESIPHVKQGLNELPGESNVWELEGPNAQAPVELP